MRIEDEVSQDADRADWLERIARLIYEAEIMEAEYPSLSDDLLVVLHKYEARWHLKVEEPYHQYYRPEKSE